ncbi:DJ-1/PfpI family protein [Flavobacterium wongokense]|uniref:DJ-1/PfpI family protein n=1 Tax=Flavobacterium wongokense TaxID=2910674 RepID=UPI001F3F773C|nr:DJ-1/PfpI family protein [Flavobacterium sp. WG47]MCF6133144.1 DJ-1/PfpI family protein [Flavobacterium sp. WG47]
METQLKNATEISSTKTVKSIHFLTFPQVSEQDLLAAWELMRSLAWTLSFQGQELQVTFGGFDEGSIPTHMGATLEGQRVITASDRFDVLYIPGGIGGGVASKDKRILNLIQAHHNEGLWVAANCSGVGILHRAGILQGLEVSSTGILARRLQQLGTAVTSPRLAWRIDDDKKIMTSGGAGTVHPSTIALVWKLFGEEAAKGLSAAWDSLPLHGNSLFSADGPVMNDIPELLSGVQDQFEMIFLPD